MSIQPPNLDDLRAQRDAGRFGSGGPFSSSGLNPGCNGCFVLAVLMVVVTAALAAVIAW